MSERHSTDIHQERHGLCSKINDIGSGAGVFSMDGQPRLGKGWLYSSRLALIWTAACRLSRREKEITSPNTLGSFLLACQCFFRTRRTIN